VSGHLCDTGCRDHADAARESTLTEVEQVLAFRWRDAWKEWGRLVAADAPESTRSIAWGRQSQALDDAEAVAALRGPGGVESLTNWLQDEIQAGGW
jgi:hypothetical protein